MMISEFYLKLKIILSKETIIIVEIGDIYLHLLCKDPM